MLITLEEMKNYLRVDYEDDDELIKTLILSAQRICMDILRTDDSSVLLNIETIEMVMDIWTEKGNDGATYDNIATQEDFDKF